MIEKTIHLNPKAFKARKFNKRGNCDTCGESRKYCGCYPDVDSLYGTYRRDSFPWYRMNGLRIIGAGFPVSAEKNYRVIWKLAKLKKIDLLALVADFYLLDGIASCVIVPEAGTPQTVLNPELLLEMHDAGFYVRSQDDQLTMSTMQASIAFAKLCTKMTPIVRDYMHFAMAGEISCNEEIYQALGGMEEWGCSTISWWHMIQKFGYEKCSRWAASAFEDNEWNDGYGGEAWAGIARVALAYETNNWMGRPFGSREFLDRAFSLQHNNDTVFDKTSWKHSLNRLYYVLEAHANSDWAMLYSNSSNSTKAIFNRHVKGCGLQPSEILGG